MNSTATNVNNRVCREFGASAAATLRYQCQKSSGALLLLKENAHKTYLNCGMPIKRYIAAHIEHWYNFARDRLGIELQEHEILFVSGFTKTAVWAAATFQSGSTQGELLISGGCFAPAGAGGEFHVSMSHAMDASVASRIGPSDRMKSEYSAVDDAVGSSQSDQCIFLNYYKAKRRKAWRPLKVIRAAAGPHDLPRSPGSSGSGSSTLCSSRASSTTEEFEPTEVTFHAVYP